MINLTDKELFNYLMTSDFIEKYTHEEYIFLLKEFRHRYRLSHSKQSSLQYELDSLEKDNLKLVSIIDELKLKVDEDNIYINSEKKRKLSMKERIKGKHLPEEKRSFWGFIKRKK